MLNKKYFLIIASSLLISCSGVNFSEWHFPYMMPVSQGNIITDTEYKHLKIGMTKEQVSYVLGHPMTQYLFSQNRWDYTYQLYKNNDLKKSYDVVVLFDQNNKVSYFNKKGELFEK